MKNCNQPDPSSLCPKTGTAEAAIDWTVYGNELIQAGRYTEAIVYFEGLRDRGEVDPAGIHCQLGVICFRLGEWEQAEQHFLQALQLGYSLAETYFNLGLLQESRQKPQNALSYYREALLRRENDPDCLYRMGLCCLQLDQYQDAKSFFSESLRLAPNQAATCSQLAALYLQDGQLSLAKQVLKVALVSNPDIPEVLQALAALCQGDGEFEQAIGYYHKLVILDDQNAVAFYQLGECCLALEMPKQAESFFAQAAKLNVLWSQPLLRLGEVFEKRKKYDLAAAVFEEWLKREAKQIVLQEQEKKQQFVEKCDHLISFWGKKGETGKLATIQCLKNIVKGEPDVQSELSPVMTDERDALRFEDF